MKTNYALIKEKIKGMSLEDADKYIVKMYNNGVITANQLGRLDIFNINNHPIGGDVCQSPSHHTMEIGLQDECTKCGAKT